MTHSADAMTPLERYTVVSEQAADRVIRGYSTSFGTATRLLGPQHRTHVRNVYALVRVADELVDGVASEAGLDAPGQHLALSRLEAEVDEAITRGYSSNPIVHAFAGTARAAGIGQELTRPFFVSMRTDLPARTARPVPQPLPAEGLDTCFDDEAHARYVYGSAEVIGLMCLRIFLRHEALPQARLARLERGARSLGAAFQNVNFLRDLADDTGRLRRSYLSERGTIDRELQQRWVGVVRDQLTEAAAVVPLLPRDARLAVTCALGLFARLTERLARLPAEQLCERRVRLAAPEKALVLVRAVLDTRTGGAR